MGKNRWWGSELEKIRKDYERSTLTVTQIVKKHGTSLGQLAKLAKKHQWISRRGLRRNSRLPALKIRRVNLGKKIEKYQREYKELDNKIRFIESLSSSSPAVY